MSRTKQFHLGIFGDGSDGAATISTAITLSRDMFYSSLTVETGGIINTDGHGIFCLTPINIKGAIICLGNDAIDEFNAGLPTSTGRFSASQNGGAISDTPFDGVQSNDLFYVGYSNSTGGEGGFGNGTSGGLSGSGVSIPNTSGGVSISYTVPIFFGAYGLPSGHGVQVCDFAPGGASGGGDNVAWGGNSGGGGGGHVCIIAPGIYGDGTLAAYGGSGQTAASSGGSILALGGGGGGGGGLIRFVTINDCSINSFTFATNGGDGGPGENGGDSGAAGGNGTNLYSRLTKV